MVLVRRTVLTPGERRRRAARVAMTPVLDAFDEARLRGLHDNLHRAEATYRRTLVEVEVTERLRSALGASRGGHGRQPEINAARTRRNTVEQAVRETLESIDDRRQLEALWRACPDTYVRVRAPGDGLAATVELRSV